jgi:hypothetical protein
MDGRQSEGRPEHPGQTGARAESGQPLPGEEACDPDDQVLPGGGEGCEKGGWAGGPLPVPQDVPIPGHETEGLWYARARRCPKNMGAVGWRIA